MNKSNLHLRHLDIEILHWIVDIGLVMTGSIIAISSSIFPALIPKLPWGPLTVSTKIYIVIKGFSTLSGILSCTGSLRFIDRK